MRRVYFGFKSALRYEQAAAARHTDRVLFALGADPDRLRWGIGRDSASLFARFSAMHGSVAAPAADAQKEVFVAAHDAYDMNRHARVDGAQTAVLTDDFLDSFAIMGPVDLCIERLGALREIGIDSFHVSGASSISDVSEAAEASGTFVG